MKEFKCEICEKVYKTKKYLGNHYNYHHNNSGNVHNCNVCTKSFQSKKTLLMHIKSVHGRKRHECKSCGTLCSRAADLKKHIYTVHEGHKDYKYES